MKLVATELGQVLQLLVMEELRPYGGLVGVNVVKAIADHYRFAKKPEKAEDNEFTSGQAVIDGKEKEIIKLAWYPDGIVVQCRYTEDAEIVFEDFMAWATREFNFRQPMTKRPRTFASRVVVEFDIAIDQALIVFETMRSSFAAGLKAAYDIDAEVSLKDLGVGVDPLTPITGVIPEFTLERRAGIPYSQNRYFSYAPVQTQIHLDMLHKLEAAVVKLKTSH